MKFSTSIATHFAWCFTLHFLICAVNASENSTSSWAKLQISPETLCSMRYGNFRVKIYEHSNNHKSTTDASKKRYFYAPIAMLDHKSATSKFNNATKEAEMRFRIEMWNDHVQNEVVNYLPPIVGHEIKPYQVQIISFEQVLLATKKPSTVYSLSTDWYPYALEESLWFTLSCFQQKDCNQLKDIMLTDPTEFHHLKLLFSLSSQTSQTKEIVIRLENVATGKMVSKLLQKYKPDTDPLLTAEDENQILSETATNVMVETFDDSDVVSRNSKAQIYTMMKDLLVSSRTTISKQDDKMWNSVFWNDENYRPDKSSRKLNDIFNRQDKVAQNKMLDLYQKDLKGFEVRFGGFSLGSAVDINREGSTSKEDMDKLYHESKDHVEWNGEKFVPKPISLSRINLGNLRDAQKFQDRSVRVRYSTAVLSTPIHFTQFTNVSNSDEWIKLGSSVSTLKKELDDLKFKHEILERDSQMANKILLDVRLKMESDLFITKNELKALRKELKENATSDINFCAYRAGQYSFTNNHWYVPYENAPVNKGNGMEPSTGIFTAPKTGTYLFTFHAEMNPKIVLHLTIRLNSEAQTRIFNDKYSGGDSWFQKSAVPRWQTSAMSILFSLNVNDKVGVYLDEGAIVGSAFFCGILI